MPEPEKVQLITRSELPGAEIIVLDGNRQFVYRGVGAVDVTLTPGVYTIQYRAGSACQDVTVALRPSNAPIVVPAPELRMKSPAPITGNKAGDQYGEVARACSTAVDESAGAGGQLFIFLRMATSDLPRTAEVDNRLAQVTLLDANRKVVTELHSRPPKSPEGLYVACNLELSPGAYILKFDAAEIGSLEQSCYVSEGWQTQVFASSRLFEANIIGPDLPHAAIFMVPRGDGFSPGDTEVLRTESLRQALEQGGEFAPEQWLQVCVTEANHIRESAPLNAVDELLKEKFSHPMLGIYGAHLLLLSPKCDWDLLRAVAKNLMALVGNHPDVAALTVFPQLRDLAEAPVFTVPPMLRSSWRSILGATESQPGLVPVGSYSGEIASRTWGSGAWLVWRSPEPEAARQAASRADVATAPAVQNVPAAIDMVQKYLLLQIKSQGAAVFIKNTAADRRFTSTERAILIYSATVTSQSKTLLDLIRSNAGAFSRFGSLIADALARVDWIRRIADIEHPDSPVLSQITEKSLASALGVPSASLNHAILSLAAKVSQPSA